MLFALDGMQELMEGGGTFDRDLYDSLVACFERQDPRLAEAQDLEWGAMIGYAASGGLPGDPWYPCEETEENGIEVRVCKRVLDIIPT